MLYTKKTRYWKVPYYWLGSMAYDLLAGSKGLSSSYFLSKSKALEVFPTLRSDALKGAIVYYDGTPFGVGAQITNQHCVLGEHNDSRMNVVLGLTSVKYGATVANHVEVVGLLKDKDSDTGEQKLIGAHLRDTLTGEEWDVHAKVSL